MYNLCLEGRVALVTGASRGIGKAVAIALAAHGAAVVVQARPERADALALTCEEVAAQGRAMALTADLADAAAIPPMFEAIDKAFGRLDIIVNNAAITAQTGLLSALTLADWRAVLAVNLEAPLLCMQQAMVRMRRQGSGGRIINITSIRAHLAFADDSAYCMAKAALEMLTKLGAVEFGPMGITVNAIAPGVIETERTSASINRPGPRELLTAHIALGRFGREEDIPGAVLLLASDAGSFITGTTLFVDGGHVIQGTPTPALGALHIPLK